jgi:ABC-2 type transport system permease protein
MTSTASAPDASAPEAASTSTSASIPIVVERARVATAFRALLMRDLFVLRRNLREFIPRTLLQPLLLVFVFAYVFPKIGQGVGGVGEGSTNFSTLLVAGVLGSVILFQGIQAVALPLVQEFGFTREIEDRVLAPMPTELVAVQKVVSGAIQCLVAGLIVFPIAYFVPATPVHLRYHWLELITLGPLTCIMAASLGLWFGTRFNPRSIPILFGVVVVPLTFLGCVYYPWGKLEAIRWLQILVLGNPLVYMSEAFRAALTDSSHMSLFAVYPVMLAMTAFFLWRGIAGFTKRVIS